MEGFIIRTATFVRLWMHSCCCGSNQRRKVKEDPDGRLKEVEVCRVTRLCYRDASSCLFKKFTRQFTPNATRREPSSSQTRS